MVPYFKGIHSLAKCLAVSFLHGATKFSFGQRPKLEYKIQASEPKTKEKCCEAAIIAGGKVW